jgi:hypothetical protein
MKGKADSGQKEKLNVKEWYKKERRGDTEM